MLAAACPDARFSFLVACLSAAPEDEPQRHRGENRPVATLPAGSSQTQRHKDTKLIHRKVTQTIANGVGVTECRGRLTTVETTGWPKGPRWVAIRLHCRLHEVKLHRSPARPTRFMRCYLCRLGAFVSSCLRRAMALCLCASVVRGYDLAASSIQHPASSIQHPASSIQHPASRIEYRTTSNEQRAASGTIPR